jgi:hypothetical protein
MMKKRSSLVDDNFDQLNPINDAIVPPFDKHDVQIEEEDNMFGVGAFILRGLLGHLLIQSFFYFEGYLTHNLCIDFFVWWWTHEGQFPNVTFLAKQILGIPGS